MIYYKCIAVSYLAIVLVGCSASEDTADDTNNNNPGNTSFSHCISDDVKTTDDDIFVVIDAFNGLDMPTTIENSDPGIELTNILLYSEVSFGVAAANLSMAFGPMLNSGFCDAEYSGNNLCNFTISDPSEGTSFVVSGSVSNNALTFNTLTRTDDSSSPDVPLAYFEGDVSPYWNGSFTIYADPTDTSSTDQTISWSRTGSAEEYRMDFPSGDYVHVVENNDCSGAIASKDTANGGQITTVDGSWQISGNTTTGEVTRCVDTTCNTLSW